MEPWTGLPPADHLDENQAARVLSVPRLTRNFTLLPAPLRAQESGSEGQA